MSNPSVTVLFFGSLSEQLGKRSETLELNGVNQTLSSVRQLLSLRGGYWTKLAENTILSAVNQQIVGSDYTLKSGDEIAFFPPVTGG